MKSKTNLYSRAYIAISSLVLALITTLVYLPSLNYDFQFDDIANIQKHFNIRHYGLRGLFFSGSRWISYWLNSIHYQIGQFNPFSYRVCNLFIHISNGLLIFSILLFVLTRLKQDNFFKHNAYKLACLTSLLFLIHPVQTQTISYVIQGQLEGLAMLSVLSMIGCFLQLTYTKNLLTQYILTGGLFCMGVLACGTKEITIVAAALIALVDWFFVAQGSWEKFKKRIPLHIALGAMMLGLYAYLLKPKLFADIFSLRFEVRNNIGNIITQTPQATIKPLHYFISQFKVILHYLWIFIWPLGISVEYDWKLSRNIFAPDSIFPLLLLFALAFIIYKLLKQNKIHLIGFGALWFAICIAPRSSIIPSPELLVDYKTYLASFGWLFILAAGLIKLMELAHDKYHIMQKNARHYIAPILLTFILGGLTLQRNTVWRSGLEFWANIIENAPGKARAYNNYGVELSQNFGKFSESIPYFQRAIDMDKYYPDPLNNIAVAYSQVNKTDEAITSLKKSLKINPHYPEGYNNLASLFLQKKDYEQAEKCLQTALKLRPHYGKAHFNLGRVYFDQNNKEKGWSCFKKCCMEGDLDNEIGFEAYAKASLAVKKYDDAIFAYKKILNLNASVKDGEFNLANAYFMSGKYNLAKQLYQKLVLNNPHDQRIWYNLGETHFKKNNIQQAIISFNRALALQKNNPQHYMRLAACYEKIENPGEAKKTLSKLLNKNFSDSTKSISKILITQLETKYKV